MIKWIDLPDVLFYVGLTIKANESSTTLYTLITHLNTLFKIFDQISRAIFPNLCFQCEKPGPDLFCQKCLLELFCPKIRLFEQAKGQQDPSISVLSVLRYSHGVERLIKCKFVDRPAVFQSASTLLAKAILALPEEFLVPKVVVPVPCHWTRLASRGFNQSAIMAQALAKELDWRVTPLLSKRFSTKSQASTASKVARIKNVQDCFEFCGKFSIVDGEPILLVDDLVTSGATLLHCAKVIKTVLKNSSVTAITLSSKDL